MFVCDDEYATIGTVNLDYRSFIHHYECGLWMYKEASILDMKADFLDTASSDGIRMNLKKIRRPWIICILKDILKIFAPLF